VNITGSIVLPPPDESSSCVMSQTWLTLQQGDTGTCGSGGFECPDIYLDDAKIWLH
jgi:hypothetical protein